MAPLLAPAPPPLPILSGAMGELGDTAVDGLEDAVVDASIVLVAVPLVDTVDPGVGTELGAVTVVDVMRPSPESDDCEESGVGAAADT